MFATLSDENRILQIIREHNLTLSFVSALASHNKIPYCSTPTLTQGLGGKGLRRETSQPLLELMKELDALTRLFEPIKIRLENAGEVYDWLRLARTGITVILMSGNEVVERNSIEHPEDANAGN